MWSLSLADVAQYAVGLSLASPMFFVSQELLRGGEYVVGTALAVVGLATVFLPTLFVNRVLGRVRSAPGRFLAWVKAKIAARLPSLPFR